MVMAVTGRRVIVMPLTTEGERLAGKSLPIPAPVAKAMGLSGDVGSSLVPGELNAFDGVSHDLRATGPTASFLFGRRPPGFFATADACLQTTPLSRDWGRLSASAPGANETSTPSRTVSRRDRGRPVERAQSWQDSPAFLRL